jgi:hypothetical protein
MLAISACGGGGPAAGGGTADAIIAAFKTAGLEAEDLRAMTKEDYGDAPFVCTGSQFSLPSLGADTLARVFICDTREEMTSLKTYFNVLGQGNPELRSWTFSKETMLLQIDGSMPREQAKKYEAALP